MPGPGSCAFPAWDGVLVGLSFAYGAALLVGAVDSAGRHRAVVDVQHGRAQLHSHAVLPVGAAEHGLLPVPLRADRHPPDTLAAASPRSPRRAPLPASTGAASSRWRPVWWQGSGACWRLPPATCSSGIYLPGYARRPRAVLPPGTFRARPRHDQPLRPVVQPVLLQRRLSRRASLASGRALDAAAAAPRAGARGGAAGRRSCAGSTRSVSSDSSVWCCARRGCSVSSSRATSVRSGCCCRSCHRVAAGHDRRRRPVSADARSSCGDCCPRRR